ncbi:hypothetical protein LINPERPRIM_LOCUS21658 [Linum perenne]
MFLEEGEHIDHGGKHDHSSGDERPRSPRKGGSKAGKHVQKSGDKPISCFLCNGPHLVRTCPKRRKINDLETKALIDTGANDNFLDVKEARRLGITYEKGKGMMKTVNSEATPIYGVARKVQMRLGEWQGEVDFQVVDMDDYPTVLGIEFMDGMDVIYMARSSTMLLPGKLGTIAVPLIREDLEPRQTVKSTQKEIHLEAVTRTS